MRMVILILSLVWCGPLLADQVGVDRNPQVATERAYSESVDLADSDESFELATLRKEIAETYQRLAKENRNLLQQQAHLERNDPIAKGLRERLIQAEKQVRKIRSSLQSRLEAIEEIRTIDIRREELIKEVELLKKRERALLDSRSSGQSS